MDSEKTVAASSRNSERHSLDSLLAVDETLRAQVESAVLRRLVSHLQQRTDVQNIDLMNLAGFCRNCLARWYQEEAEKYQHTLDKDDSRFLIYNMSQDDWKNYHQT